MCTGSSPRKPAYRRRWRCVSGNSAATVPTHGSPCSKPTICGTPRAARKAIERISRARTILEILRDEYPGDEAWKNYVDCFRPDWEARQDQAQLREKLPEDLAIVLSWHFGDRAWRWYTQPVPALGGKTPQSVHSGPSGETTLRNCIMRIPV